ncbi:tetratricopeptide repeat protein [Actinomadura adrarensis]|uniref:Tetratricopeptide repeat protein n=1 Tax=Actinomadura adrarensis TaxID=1819600 RepID=A0ABW3CVE0_9ACTN
MMELRLLGAVQLLVDGVTRELGSPKERCLLAILALECGSVVSVETLAARIWGDSPPPRARSTLTSYVARLRRRFRRGEPEWDEPSPIEYGHGGYRLTLVPESVDLHRFRSLRRQARAISESGDDEHAVGLLAGAEELWCGEPLSGLPGDWIRALRESLDEERHGVRLERIDLQLRLGRHGEVIAELQQLATRRPLDERVTALLMIALYRHDRAADALDVYRRVTRLLAAEQGSDPGPRLQELHGLILRRDPELGVTPRHLLGGGVRQPRSLPEEPAGFIGRERELEIITDPADADGGAPAVTVITGMGGVGKSDLAVRAAHILTARFPDAALHVRLCGHDEAQPPLSAGAVLTELLRALGIPPDRIPVSLPERARLWRREMSGRRAVVVLDDAIGPEQVRLVVSGLPSSRCLITSRRRLAGLPGARYLRLDALPPEQARILVSRIVGDRLGSLAIDDIVRRCGGLPLALRLVAAHAAQRNAGEPCVPVADIELTDVDDTVARRAFNSSYRDLTELQQRLFRRLGWSPCRDITAEAAAVLVACPIEDVYGELEVLLDHHLICESAPERLYMHDVVREFARVRALDEDSESERRRALSRLVQHYLRSADRADRMLYPHRPRRDLVEVRSNVPPQADTEAWLQREWRNGLAVAEYAIEHEMKENGALLVHVLSRFLEAQCRREEAAKAQETAVRAARETRDSEALAHALLDLSFTRFRTGECIAALDHADEAMPIFRARGDLRGEADTLDRIGIINCIAGRYREALAHFQEAQDLHRRVGNANGEAESLGYAALVQLHLGRYSEALQYLQYSLSACRRVENRLEEAKVLNNIGDIQRRRGMHRDAISHYEESSAILKRVGGAVQYEAIIKNNIGGVRQYKGDYPGALRCYREAIKVFRAIADRPNVADVLNSIGTTYLLMGCVEEALIHYQQAGDLAQDVGDPYQHVRALRGIADVHQATARYEVALGYYNKALDIACEISDPYQQGKVFEGMGATVLHLHGEKAARIHWRQALEIFEEIGVPEAECVAIRLHPIDGVAS